MRRILIVDDNAMNRLMLKSTLEDDYDVIEAEDGKEALQLMHKHYKILSAVLLDIIMPEMDGYEVLRRVRDNMLLAQIPIIMVTGSEDEQSRVKALSLGANDFIQKPFNPEIVKHCLKNNITLRETASILNAIQRDKLTGLYNREAFFDKVSAMIKAAADGYYILSCFDIDNFKLINDQYGVMEGDRILREIGQAVKHNMDEIGGTAGRISADNFAALFPYEKRDTDILQRIQDKKLVTLEHRTIVFSVGRHIITDSSLPASAIYDRAFIAKQSVKGRYDTHLAYFDDAMLEKLVRDQMISGSMETALSEHQFEVWFQPQHNHSTGALVGAEALVRWRHPEEGLIPPNEFIPVFEDNGFVYELDKYVWEETCRHLRKWIDEGRNPLPVSVNLSRYDVFRPDILEVLTGLTAKYGLPNSLLRLEITESAFSKSTQTIVNIVKELIAHDFTIEIDDFGSGYSSLNTLKNVPAQIVKLDMRFLEDDDDSGRGGNIIESVVRMAKWLDMSVIAEGVEEKQQADYLASIGCSYIQGYYYAQPMPASDYEDYCRGACKEERLLSMEAVAQLDKNSFWNPKSMDTLIFNSYVGAACVFEYNRGNIELLRANTKFAALLGNGSMSVEDTLKLDWIKCLTHESLEAVREVLNKSRETGEEYPGEYVFTGIPGRPELTYLRATMRVIATTELQMLVYCTCENITAQRQAEQSLIEAKAQELSARERLQLVLENIDSAVLATIFEDEGARVVFANDKYYDQLGYTKEQYACEMPDPFSFIHPEDRPHAIEVSTRNNAIRQPYSLTYRLIRRDGSVFWRQSRISFIDFPGEKLPVQLSVSSDITALKEAEQQHAAVTGQLQAVMDNVGCGITAITYNGDAVEYLMINDHYYEMLGYNKEEYHLLKAFSPICEEDRQRVMDISKKVYSSGGTATVECRASRADGSLIWLRCSLTMTHFSGIDKPVQLAIFTDITTERTATQELLDNLPGGAALYEYDGEMLVPIYINKRYWELVGRAPTDYAGRSVISAVHPDDENMVLEAFHDAMRTGGGVSIDIRTKYGQSEYRPLHFEGRLIRKPSGKYAVYASYSTVSNEELTIRETLPIALTAVMSASSDISFVKGKDMKYISCSRGFALLAGLESAEALIGKDSTAVFPPELAAENEAVDRSILESGRSVVDVDLLFPVNGEIRHLLFSKYPLMDTKGNILGVYGSGRDETEARRVKSQLEILANSVPGGIATYEGTPDALDEIKLVYFSDGFCRLYGYSREEYEQLAAVNPLGLVSSGDLSGMYESVLNLVNKGVPMDYVYRVQVNGGGYKWINVQAVMGEPNGDKLTVNAVFIDVTEQKAAVERLRMSEEEWRLAIHHSNRMVCRYDVAEKQLTLLYNADPIFGSLDGFEDIPNSSVRDGLISEETTEAYLAFYESILKGQKSGSTVFQRMSQIGWRWLEGQFTTIFSSDQKPCSAIATFTDITDKRERDAAYHRWQQSLRDKDPADYSVFRCNISRNAPFDANSGDLLRIQFKDGEWTFDKQVKEYARQYVHEDDRDAYIAFLKSGTLLSAYYAGTRSCAMEYREILTDGEYRWLRVTVDTTEYENSTDVEVYLLHENIDAAKRAELLMREQAQSDPLTGLFNRNTFANKAAELIASSSPSTQHALIILDIDGFKQINDVHGHAVGDRVLIEVANLLQASLRRNDLLCRLGGDEFLILLSNIPDKASAENKARRICELVRSASDSTMRVACSIGVVLFSQDGTNLDALYRKADTALYYVKASGKGSFAFYQDEMGTMQKQ